MAVQSGFYFVKSTPGGTELLKLAASVCHDTGDGQIALNVVLNRYWTAQKEPLPPADGLGTRVQTCVAKEDISSNLNVGILRKRYFPTGCTFLGEASARAKMQRFVIQIALIYLVIKHKANLER